MQAEEKNSEMLEGPGTYQGNKHGKLSEIQKKALKDWNDQRKKASNFITTEKDILNELSSDESMFPPTPQVAKRGRGRGKKSHGRVTAGASKVGEQTKQVMKNPKRTGRIYF